MPSAAAGHVDQANTVDRATVLPDVNSKGEVSALEQLKQALPDLGRNRRAHTSAAMLGLALSVGISDFLLHSQRGQALAVEPNSATTSEAAVPVLPTAADLAATVSEVEPSEAPITTFSSETEVKATVLEHIVQEGQTLWDIARLYRVDAAAIAASNHLPPETVLRVGQILRIPSINGIVHELQAGETLEAVSRTYQVAPQQLAAPGEGQGTPNPVVVPGNVNDLLKAKQEVALNRLKEKRESLKQSLETLQTAPAPETTAPETTAPASPLTVSAALESSQPFPTPTALAERAGTGAASSAATPPTAVPTVPPLLQAGVSQDKPLQIAAIPNLRTVPYQVQVGDTLNEIANRYGTSQAELINLNRLRDPNVLWAGQTLQVPHAAAQMADQAAVVALRLEDTEVRSEVELPSPLSTPPAAASPAAPQAVASITPGGNTYRVNPGDTLDGIARNYGVSRDLLVAVNQISDPNRIEVDQVLRIPQANRSPVAAMGGGLPVVTGVPVETRNFPATSPMASNPTVFPNLVSPAGTTTVPTTSGPNSDIPVITGIPVPEVDQASAIAFAPIGTRQPQAPPVEAAPSFEPQRQYSPYVERLKAEVMQLRSRYSSWTPSQTTATSPTPVTADEAVAATIAPTLSPTAIAPATSAAPTRSGARVNPDWQGVENYNAGIYRRWQSGQTARVEAPKVAPVPSEQLIAAAPLTSEAYDPIIQQSLGRTVSPDLPALSNPDSYLPDAAPVFNGYSWPARGVLTSGFGWRWGRMHKGIDIAAPIGTPIVAAAGGVVVTAGWNSGGYGNLVEIQHPDGSLTLYAHNNRILVRPGQQVEQGQQIAEMGSTGFSTGPHLHFEIHPAGRGAVNPIAFLPSR
ncbi:LysM peptidoglycan-binding domain-containing protein [Trichothermofontia sp.]